MKNNFFQMLEIFFVFLRLGLTSFGGPMAHLGYFYEEFVKSRKWINEQVFTDLVTLCQFLPGPASSQVGMSIGLFRGGIGGALCAWLGFTLPSAILLVLLALGILSFDSFLTPFIHGTKVVAVAIVAQALTEMFKNFCSDIKSMWLAILSSLVTLYYPFLMVQIFLLVFSALVGVFFLKKPILISQGGVPMPISKRMGLSFLFIFLVILVGGPLLVYLVDLKSFVFFNSFFRAGSFVFGGGHVILPLLQAEVVTPGWVSPDLFMTGYGMAQIVPGPLLSVGAFFGAVMPHFSGPWIGALIALLAIFLPSFLIIIGVLPFWDWLRQNSPLKWAWSGLGAAVVGFLLAAFINPVVTTALLSFKDMGLALFCFILLRFLKPPSWFVIILGVTLSYFLQTY